MQGLGLSQTDTSHNDMTHNETNIITNVYILLKGLTFDIRRLFIVVIATKGLYLALVLSKLLVLLLVLVEIVVICRIICIISSNFSSLGAPNTKNWLSNMYKTYTISNNNYNPSNNLTTDTTYNSSICSTQSYTSISPIFATNWYVYCYYVKIGYIKI